MEKEKTFFTEIQELMSGTDSPEVEKAAMVLVKEAIRTMAKNGHRQFNMGGLDQLIVNVNGMGVYLAEGAFNRIKEELVKEGFTIVDLNGYRTIQW